VKRGFAPPPAGQENAHARQEGIQGPSSPQQGPEARQGLPGPPQELLQAGEPGGGGGARALDYSTAHRRRRRRDFRALWIARINAAARMNGTTYSKLLAGLKAVGIDLDRKILADLALAVPADFAAVVKAAKA
jgi:hypothetical protein